MSKQTDRIRRIEAKRPVGLHVRLEPSTVDDPAAREHAVRFLMSLLDRLDAGEAT